MNPYVGIAKNVPDSRTPRRFIAIRATTSRLATVASWPLSDGIAAAAYCAPDEMVTATVST